MKLLERKKKNKSIQLGPWFVRLKLFTDGMLIYRAKDKKWNDKPVKKVVGYKLNAQILVVVPYINNELEEIKEIIPLKMVSKTIKYLEMNKSGAKLYFEGY